MKKIVCLLLQVVSLGMWFIYIVDKQKIFNIFDIKTVANQNSTQVLYILMASMIMFISVIGFLVPEKPSNKTATKNKHK